MEKIKKLMKEHKKLRYALYLKGEKVKISKGNERQNMRIDYFNIVYALKSCELEIKNAQLMEEHALRELEFVCL